MYRGWHTNVPGEDMGREHDDVLCLVLAARKLELHGYEIESARLMDELATLKARWQPVVEAVWALEAAKAAAHSEPTRHLYGRLVGDVIQAAIAAVKEIADET